MTDTEWIFVGLCVLWITTILTAWLITWLHSQLDRKVFKRWGEGDAHWKADIHSLHTRVDRVEGDMKHIDSKIVKVLLRVSEMWHERKEAFLKKWVDRE